MKNLCTISNKTLASALLALPLVFTPLTHAQAPPPIQDPAATYCLGLPPTSPTTPLPAVWQLAPCLDAPHQTLADAPPTADGVTLPAAPAMPLCATAVETDLLRIIHDLLGAYQPTTTAPLGQGQ